MPEPNKNNAVMPNGIDNFYELITTRNNEGNPFLFVDKTLFIREFLKAQDKVILITRPRRFGKTLTLSMLQHFLAKEVDGKPTKMLFDGLKVSEYPATMKFFWNIQVIYIRATNTLMQEFVVNLTPELNRIISYFGEEMMAIYGIMLPKQN